MKRAILKSPAFVKDARRVIKKHPEIAADLNSKLQALSNDASDPALKSHKIKGNLAGRRACSIGYDLRIVVEFVQHKGSEAVLLHAIGTHDEVY